MYEDIDLRIAKLRTNVFGLIWHESHIKSLMVWYRILEAQRLLKRYSGRDDG